MLEKILLELLNIKSEYPSDEQIPELIQILKDKISLPYAYYEDGKRYLVFSNTNLTEELGDREILMVCNHFDTVSIPSDNVNGILKSTEDFEESWVLGRGSVDDKPNMAIMIDLVKEIKKSNKVIIYGITFDEETEVQGSKQMVQMLKGLNIKPDNVLLVEPTNMCPSCNSSGGENSPYWNRLEQEEKEIFLFKKLKEMNMEYSYPMTPPCEAGDYKKLGCNVVICGPGYTNLCHNNNERIEISSLYEWKERMKWLIENNLK